MKKFLAVLVAVLLIASSSYGAWFYWAHFRGVGPVIRPPAGDITTTLPSANQPTPTKSTILTSADGFQTSIWAKDLGKPRMMTWGSNGEILVSIPESGTIVALRDTDNDGLADEKFTVVRNLRQPQGIATICNENGSCELYVAESHQVSLFTYAQFATSNKKVLLSLPDGGRHPLKNLQIIDTEQGRKMLITVASACDACKEADEKRGTVMIANIDGSDLQIFAQGLRNAAFMAMSPVTGKVWGTEMGRDFLGDDLPPDEINILEQGQHYGWPYCYGKNQTDTTIRNVPASIRCSSPEMTPSHIDIPAHSAPLGLAFVPEEGWPEEYWYNLLVAMHGSWNRSEPAGYKIVRYKLSAEGAYLGEEDFISGWLDGDNAWGRPVDILIQPGGTLYISDDHAGVIYKVQSR